MAFRARALVVDDDADIRKVVVRICAQLGLESVEAADGVVALEQLRSGGADVMVLDIFMPRMDGLRVLEEMRTTASDDLPGVLVLTSNTDPQGKMEATTLGAIDFVTKPFRFIDLERRIERVLTITEMERRLRHEEASLREMRSTDPITGVGPTAQLFDALEREFAAAHDGQGQLACLVLSDERYNEILDESGPEAAARRLTTLARVVGNRATAQGLLFRVDAAELVLLMPGCSSEEAREAAREIGRVVDDLDNILNEELAIAVAAVPHGEINEPSQLFRALNLSLAQARSHARTVVFERF